MLTQTDYPQERYSVQVMSEAEKDYIINHLPTRARALGLIPYEDSCRACGSPDGCVCCGDD